MRRGVHWEHCGELMSKRGQTSGAARHPCGPCPIARMLRHEVRPPCLDRDTLNALNDQLSAQRCNRSHDFTAPDDARRHNTLAQSQTIQRTQRRLEDAADSLRTHHRYIRLGHSRAHAHHRHAAAEGVAAKSPERMRAVRARMSARAASRSASVRVVLTWCLVAADSDAAACVTTVGPSPSTGVLWALPYLPYPPKRA